MTPKKVANQIVISLINIVTEEEISNGRPCKDNNPINENSVLPTPPGIIDKTPITPEVVCAMVLPIKVILKSPISFINNQRLKPSNPQEKIPRGTVSKNNFKEKSILNEIINSFILLKKFLLNKILKIFKILLLKIKIIKNEKINKGYKFLKFSKRLNS